MNYPTYPTHWPKCPICGGPALHDHITCGKVSCNEGALRRSSVTPPISEEDVDRVVKKYASPK